MRMILMLLALAISASAATAQQYRLQPGDTVEVTVFQEPDLGRQIVVAPDGRVSFPLVGHLRAGGLSVEGLERAIKKQLEKYYNTELDVTVLLSGTVEPRTLPIVYVTGEVQKPGPLEMTTPTTVLQALAMAGGLGPFAAKRRIQIRRRVKGEEILFPFDYDAAEDGHEIVGNITLQHGDVIIVPERGLFE